MQAAHQAKGEWRDSWRIQLNPGHRTEGFCFHLVGCPIAKHAKEHGYGELTTKAVLKRPWMRGVVSYMGEKPTSVLTSSTEETITYGRANAFRAPDCRTC